MEEERDKLRKELLEPEKMCSTRGYIILAVLIVVTVVLILFWARISSAATKGLTSFVQNLLKLNVFLCYSVIFLMMFVWLVFPLPGFNIMSMLVALAFQRFLPPFFLFLSSQIAAAVFLYLITKYVFRQRLIKKFSENILYQFLLHNGQKNPFLLALGVRFIEIQASYKNVMLTLAKVKFR